MKLLYNIIGYIAGIGTTISFLPQIIDVINNGKTENISLIMFCIHTTGVSLWVTYGVLVKNYIIVVFNGITLGLCTTMLCYLIKDKLSIKKIKEIEFVEI